MAIDDSASVVATRNNVTHFHFELRCLGDAAIAGGATIAVVNNTAPFGTGVYGSLPANIARAIIPLNTEPAKPTEEEGAGTEFTPSAYLPTLAAGLRIGDGGTGSTTDGTRIIVEDNLFPVVADASLWNRRDLIASAAPRPLPTPSIAVRANGCAIAGAFVAIRRNRIVLTAETPFYESHYARFVVNVDGGALTNGTAIAVDSNSYMYGFGNEYDSQATAAAAETLAAFGIRNAAAIAQMPTDTSRDAAYVEVIVSKALFQNASISVSGNTFTRAGVGASVSVTISSLGGVLQGARVLVRDNAMTVINPSLLFVCASPDAPCARQAAIKDFFAVLVMHGVTTATEGSAVLIDGNSLAIGATTSSNTYAPLSPAAAVTTASNANIFALLGVVPRTILSEGSLFSVSRNSLALAADSGPTTLALLAPPLLAGVLLFFLGGGPAPYALRSGSALRINGNTIDAVMVPDAAPLLTVVGISPYFPPPPATSSIAPTAIALEAAGEGSLFSISNNNVRIGAAYTAAYTPPLIGAAPPTQRVVGIAGPSHLSLSEGSAAAFDNNAVSGWASSDALRQSFAALSFGPLGGREALKPHPRCVGPRRLSRRFAGYTARARGVLCCKRQPPFGVGQRCAVRLRGRLQHSKRGPHCLPLWDKLLCSQQLRSGHHRQRVRNDEPHCRGVGLRHVGRCRRRI